MQPQAKDDFESSDNNAKQKKPLSEMGAEQLKARALQLQKQYNEMKALGLKLDMSRGKPDAQQLDLTLGMLDCVNARDGFTAPTGTDTRNYGLVDGLPEAKKLFGDMIGMPAETVIVGGNSSLNLMFDYISMACSHGVCGGKPWSQQEDIKFICPVPGYDRHFAVTQYFGIELITVPMTSEGPDMDKVEKLVKDPTVKGIWLVPKYSNPDGITCSPKTVKRLATMKCAAKDFRVMWDNAYCVHHLYDTPDVLDNIYEVSKQAGNEDRVITFASTSKVTFPGAGIAILAASPNNLSQIRNRMSFQTIGHDKINMLRHTRYFKDIDGIKKHMKLHGALLRPKFATVLQTLDSKLKGLNIAQWNNPRGGYFVSVNLMEGTAKDTIELLKQAGVVMTPAGATFPYGDDPKDSNIRIAPTFPPVSELQQAMDLFCICAEMTAIQKVLQ